MTTMLQEVVRAGTGAAAHSLNHPLGGKTGTTNDFTDAWFIGFSPSLTCGVWVGFDDRKSLGEKETGAHAALPAWIDYMRAAIATNPQEAFAGSKATEKPNAQPAIGAAKPAKGTKPTTVAATVPTAKP
jgi:penicillin-binding protein 1A